MKTRFAPRRRAQPEALPLALPPLDLDAALPGLTAPRPWRCEVPICLHKPGWWLSKWGVLNCLNCCPPSSPGLVLRSGSNQDAPLVTEEQSRVPIDWQPPRELAPVTRKPRKSAKRVAP